MRGVEALPVVVGLDGIGEVALVRQQRRELRRMRVKAHHAAEVVIADVHLHDVFCAVLPDAVRALLQLPEEIGHIVVLDRGLVLVLNDVVGGLHVVRRRIDRLLGQQAVDERARLITGHALLGEQIGQRLLELAGRIGERRGHVPQQGIEVVRGDGTKHALGHRIAGLRRLQIGVVKDVKLAVGIRLRVGHPAQQVVDQHGEHLVARQHQALGGRQRAERLHLRRVAKVVVRHGDGLRLRILRGQRQHELARQAGHDLRGAVLIDQRVRAQQRHIVGVQLGVQARGAKVVIEGHVQPGLAQQAGDRLQRPVRHALVEAHAQHGVQIDLVARAVAVANRGRRQLAGVVAGRSLLGHGRHRRQQQRGAEHKGKNAFPHKVPPSRFCGAIDPGLTAPCGWPQSCLHQAADRAAEPAFPPSPA